MTTNIPWHCDTCGHPITPGTGYITASLETISARRRQADKKPTTGQFVTASEFLSTQNDPAQWTALHTDCDPNPASPDYWISTDRATTLTQLVDRMAHLNEKGYLNPAVTDWFDFLKRQTKNQDTRGD